MRAEYTPLPELKAIVEECMPSLHEYQEMYKDLHQNPEVGLSESRTAGIAAQVLRRLDFKVIENIGGHGLVGVLDSKTPGRTVLLRADMDALPINEQTCLQYKSIKANIMHACGHDMHLACMLATAAFLKAAISKWSGIVIILIQPNEEGGAGAQSMIDDGLYTKIPIPHVILGMIFVISPCSVLTAI